MEVHQKSHYYERDVDVLGRIPLQMGEREPDSEGRVVSIAYWQKFYGGDKVPVLSLGYYYDYGYNHSFSRKIYNSKETRRGSDLHKSFLDSSIEAIKAHDKWFDFFKIDYVTCVPSVSREDSPVSGTIFALAGEIAKIVNGEHVDLIKTDYRRRLSKDERNFVKIFEHVSGAFYIEKGELNNKRVLLVDDIRSTGMHLLECAKILKEKGAKEVVGFTLGIHKKGKPV